MISISSGIKRVVKVVFANAADEVDLILPLEEAGVQTQTIEELIPALPAHVNAQAVAKAIDELKTAHEALFKIDALLRAKPKRQPKKAKKQPSQASPQPGNKSAPTNAPTNNPTQED